MYQPHPSDYSTTTPPPALVYDNTPTPYLVTAVTQDQPPSMSLKTKTRGRPGSMSLTQTNSEPPTLPHTPYNSMFPPAPKPLYGPFSATPTHDGTRLRYEPASAVIFKKISPYIYNGKDVFPDPQTLRYTEIVSSSKKSCLITVISFSESQIVIFSNTTEIAFHSAYVGEYKVSNHILYGWKDLKLPTTRTLACNGTRVYIVEDDSTLFTTANNDTRLIRLFGVGLDHGASVVVVEKQ